MANKQLDREDMFRKIMPSAALATAASEANGDFETDEPMDEALYETEAVDAPVPEPVFAAPAAEAPPEVSLAEMALPPEPAPTLEQFGEPPAAEAPPTSYPPEFADYVDLPPDAALPSLSELAEALPEAVPPELFDYLETGEPLPETLAEVISAAPAEVYPVNLAEMLVEQIYPRYLQRLCGCSCSRCQDDACAIALNRIKPRYVPSDRFDPQDLKDRELVRECVTALVKAIFLVKRKPRHDEAEVAGL